MAILLKEKCNVGAFEQMLDDCRLSFKARGLFSFLWVHENGWEFKSSSLDDCSIADGKTSIRTGVNELEDQGYLVRKQMRNRNGAFQETVWQLFCTPIESE